MDNEKTIDNIAKEIMELAKERGLPVDPTPDNVTKLLLRINIKLGVAMDIWFDGNYEQLKEELVDVLIQTIHLLAVVKADIGDVYEKKIVKDWGKNFKNKQ
ncbi:MAG: hypothetical protein KJI71_05130 [Patescibacteria group bacterium]|nr:hypothetical protein [Patescibacteria group bacterium]